MSNPKLIHEETYYSKDGEEILLRFFDNGIYQTLKVERGGYDTQQPLEKAIKFAKEAWEISHGKEEFKGL